MDTQQQQQQHCLLCGVWLGEFTERRYRSLQEVAVLLSLFCTPTKMVYRLVQEMAKQEKDQHARDGCPECCCKSCATTVENAVPGKRLQDVCSNSTKSPLCTSCINWIRRLSLRLNPKKNMSYGWVQRTHVPMDEFLLFLVHPGFHRAPDKRVMKRSFAIITGTVDGHRNQYSCFAPPYIMQQQAVGGSNSSSSSNNNDAFLEIVRSWYYANGSPVSLGSSETGRLVRKSLEKEPSRKKSSRLRRPRVRMWW